MEIQLVLLLLMVKLLFFVINAKIIRYWELIEVNDIND